MLSTQIFGIDNSQWWFLGFLTDIKLIQIRNGQNLRVHYCNVHIEPFYDTDDYFMLPGYSLEPFTVDAPYAQPSSAPGNAHNSEMAMFVMADTENPVVVARINNWIDPREDAITLTGPNPAIISPVKVGDLLEGGLIVEGVPYSDTTWSVTGGELPPGVMLMTHGFWSGRPTVAGNYHFDTSVIVKDDPKPRTTYWYLRVYDENDPAAPRVPKLAPVVTV